LAQFNDQYKELNEQHDRETDRKAQLEAAVATEEAGVEKSKLLLLQKEQELNGLQKQFNELVNRLRQLESDKKLAAQRLEHLQERRKSLNEFLAGADTQLQQIQTSIHQSREQTEKETTELENVREALETLRAATDEKRTAYDEKK